jgi:deoxyribose-phosphate aldolase
MEKTDIAKMIDHTLLKADASSEEIKKLCQEADEYGFATVCVNPWNIAECFDLLKKAKICTVIGFPLGANDPEVKILETKRAISDGANEVDMVINIGALKSGNEEFVLTDIKGVVEAAGEVPVKVIIETALLTDEQKVKVCQMCVEAGAAFVKTSTGFSTGGATVADVKLMKKTVGDNALVKASGAVRDYETAVKMIDAGASRIGTSSGIKIVT